MIKFRIPYKHRILKETFTAKELFDDICEQANVEVGSENFVNSNYVILGNAYTNNETCETILKDLAKLACGFAKIGRDNKCYIKNLKVSENYDEIVDGNHYKESFTKTGEYGIVNKVTIGLMDIEGESNSLEDAESIEQNGLTEIIINNIAFLISRQERLKVLPAMWDALKGLKYLSAEYDYKGFSYLDSGDKIKLLDIKDKEYISYIFNHTFTYNGTFSGRISTPMISKTQTESSKSTNKVKDNFRNVEYKIDKINGNITQIVEKQTDFSNKLTKNQQTIDSISSEVKSLYNFEKTIKGISEIKLDDALNTNILELRIKANKINTSLYPSKKIFPSKNLFPKKSGTNLYIDIKNADKTEVNSIYIYVGTPLISYGNTHDELIIRFNEEKGTCDVIAYRKLKSINGTISILNNPIEEIVKQVDVMLFKGDNYLSIRNITDWEMTATYIYNNELNQLFTTKVEEKSNLKLTKDEFEVSISKKVGNDEIISKINMSSEKIKILAKLLALEGYTTINGGFKVDEKGNVSIANNAVYINEKGIQMANGTSIVGGNGMLTQFKYSASGRVGHLASTQWAIRIALYIPIYIPENFVITDAVLYGCHTNCYFYRYTNGVEKHNAYARNIKLYITNKKAIPNVSSGFIDTVAPEGEQKIIYDFGSLAGKTFSAYVPEEFTIKNIKDNLKPGLQYLYFADYINNPSTAVVDDSADEKSGMIDANLFVTGYIKT